MNKENIDPNPQSAKRGVDGGHRKPTLASLLRVFSNLLVSDNQEEQRSGSLEDNKLL